MNYNVIIVGAGAAGLMAAWQAGVSGKRLLLIEHSTKIGEKIRISGGGRCNFTNLFASPRNYICQNPHFVKSALAGFDQHAFIKLVESYNIAYHEKTLGQLFCDGSSQQIIDMMLDLCNKANVEIRMECSISDVTKNNKFELSTNHGKFVSDNVIIASGGLSIPKMGASDFGYHVAKKFGLNIIPTRPALVPLIVSEKDKNFTSLSGVSNSSIVSYGGTTFSENILFTHKGLSGPAILQISSYLNSFENEEIIIDILPNLDLEKLFITDKNSKLTPAAYLKNHLANRLVENLAKDSDFNRMITDLRKDSLIKIAQKIHECRIAISGSEGYAKAEVTAGGVDTDELSSKTMEAKKIPGLFFIGEVVDVTGWLGGYNFQWAWSSGFAAGTHIGRK